jgi:hypothetical protein
MPRTVTKRVPPMDEAMRLSAISQCRHAGLPETHRFSRIMPLSESPSPASWMVLGSGLRLRGQTMGIPPISGSTPPQS